MSRYLEQQARRAAIDKLTDKQTKAISMLANGFQADTIAHELNINPGTLRQWKMIPLFRAELDAAEVDGVDSIRRYMLQATYKTMSAVLERIVENPDSKHADVLKALETFTRKFGNVDGTAQGAHVEVNSTSFAQHNTVSVEGPSEDRIASIVQNVLTARQQLEAPVVEGEVLEDE